MPAFKIYKCCICHKVLDYKPIRLVKQTHDNKISYGKYHVIYNYDFCKRCYMTFQRWIDKHNKKTDE